MCDKYTSESIKRKHAPPKLFSCFSAAGAEPSERLWRGVEMKVGRFKQSHEQQIKSVEREGRVRGERNISILLFICQQLIARYTHTSIPRMRCLNHLARSEIFILFSAALFLFCTFEIQMRAKRRWLWLQKDVKCQQLSNLSWKRNRLCTAWLGRSAGDPSASKLFPPTASSKNQLRKMRTRMRRIKIIYVNTVQGRRAECSPISRWPVAPPLSMDSFGGQPLVSQIKIKEAIIGNCNCTISDR